MAESDLLMTLEQTLEAVNGSCIADFSRTPGFSSVATDSRKVVEGSLFVPLIGAFQDGHAYIAKALESGATMVFVDAAHAEGSSVVFMSLARQYRAAFVMVENTLRALQDAARAYVARFPNLLRIGITGSSGKTTTKELVASIFSVGHSVVMNEGNLNSETGLPLSVFSIRSHHEVGIFELGMNRTGEISEIARVLLPSIALITNIGTAHIGILGSKAAIAEEKKQIFSRFTDECVGLVPEADEWADFLSDVGRGTIRRYGIETIEGFEGFEDLGLDGSTLRYCGEEIAFHLPGSYNRANAIAAIAVAQVAGLPAREIKAGIEAVRALFGRTEILRGDITVIRDCYNANPDSMDKAIDFCDEVPWSGKKLYVIGSMLELGAESDKAHETVCRRLAKSKASRMYLFGDEMLRAGRLVFGDDSRVSYSESMEDLTVKVASDARNGDLVFLKGSRGMALERVCAALTQGSIGETTV